MLELKNALPTFATIRQNTTKMYHISYVRKYYYSKDLVVFIFYILLFYRTVLQRYNRNAKLVILLIQIQFSSWAIFLVATFYFTKCFIKDRLVAIDCQIGLLPIFFRILGQFSEFYDLPLAILQCLSSALKEKLQPFF